MGNEAAKLQFASESNNKGKKERATHFLCFPISSDSTITSLATSIAHFRSISTQAAKPGRRLETTADGKVRVVSQIDAVPSPESVTTQNHVDDNDPLGNLSKPIEEQKSFAESLKILPPVAQRAAGTYHLTLGVMDLSDEARMQQAKNVLEALDLQQILHDARRGPPAGSKEARKWGRTQSREEQAAATGEAIGDAKTTKTSATPPIQSSDRTPTAEHVGQLQTSLTGLGAFPSSKNARVIWARPREQNAVDNDSGGRPIFNDNKILYSFALHLNHIFRREGLITETRPLVLHATVANMRYAVQAKSGRTTKGKSWRYGKQRWKEGLVDARSLLNVFNNFGGNANAAASDARGQGRKRSVNEADDDESTTVTEPEEVGHEDEEQLLNPEKEYLWLTNIPIDRVAICKMGATKAQSEDWGEWYPPIAEKLLSEDSQ